MKYLGNLGENSVFICDSIRKQSKISSYLIIILYPLGSISASLPKSSLLEVGWTQEWFLFHQKNLWITSIYMFPGKSPPNLLLPFLFWLQSMAQEVTHWQTVKAGLMWYQTQKKRYLESCWWVCPSSSSWPVVSLIRGNAHWMSKRNPWNRSHFLST